MISAAQLETLYASKADKPRKVANKGLALIRGTDGKLAEWAPIVRMTGAGGVTLGRHEGKVGSIRRSRKGATRRLSNGRRYYNGLDSVVAYKLKPR